MVKNSTGGTALLAPQRRLGVQSARTAIPLLSLSPLQEDHRELEWILGRRWTVHAASTMASATAILQQTRVSLVICERDIPPATWRDMLDAIRFMTEPPFLVVTSSHADERLWAEALNLGAYDVLAKPFDRVEVLRILGLAWFHWK